MTEIVHAAPRGGEALTPCCRLTPFELPRTDRMTNDPSLVSCGRDPADVRTPDAFDDVAAKIVAAHYAAVSPWDADLAGVAIRNAFAVLRSHPDVKKFLMAMAEDAGALRFWGSDCTDSCDGNFSPDSMECDTCGSTDTLPIYALDT